MQPAFLKAVVLLFPLSSSSTWYHFVGGFKMYFNHSESVKSLFCNIKFLYLRQHTFFKFFNSIYISTMFSHMPLLQTRGPSLPNQYSLLFQEIAVQFTIIVNAFNANQSIRILFGVYNFIMLEKPIPITFIRMTTHGGSI